MNSKYVLIYRCITRLDLLQLHVQLATGSLSPEYCYFQGETQKSQKNKGLEWRLHHCETQKSQKNKGLEWRLHDCETQKSQNNKSLASMETKPL